MSFIQRGVALARQKKASEPITKAWQNVVTCRCPLFPYLQPSQVPLTSSRNLTHPNQERPAAPSDLSEFPILATETAQTVRGPRQEQLDVDHGHIQRALRASLTITAGKDWCPFCGWTQLLLCFCIRPPPSSPNFAPQCSETRMRAFVVFKGPNGPPGKKKRSNARGGKAIFAPPNPRASHGRRPSGRGFSGLPQCNPAIFLGNLPLFTPGFRDPSAASTVLEGMGVSLFFGFFFFFLKKNLHRRAGSYQRGPSPFGFPFATSKSMSSREVRIRVPNFFRTSILVGGPEPSQPKRNGEKTNCWGTN